MKHKPRQREQKYYGIHACLTLCERRPEDVIRVYLHKTNLKGFSRVIKLLAKQKKAYHIVSNDELHKVTKSVHHEGVCVLAKELEPISFSHCLASLNKPKICLLYLDGVQNPHNIGSIMRTCAHFGIPYILGNKLPILSPSACRIAKGGAELVRLVQLDKPLAALAKLKKKGFGFIGTSSHGGISMYNYEYPSRTLLAFGSEADGMGEDLLNQTTQKIQIPGTGFVESLNVSVATSLCLGEYTRQHIS
jgi:TrmH RNA methyltransferase